MQAHAGLPRSARTCAAALLVALLALGVAPVSAHAAGRAHAHRLIARTAVVLPTVSVDPGHAVDHHVVLPGRPSAEAALVPGAGTADSSTTAMPRTAETPPVRGPPAKGSA